MRDNEKLRQHPLSHHLPLPPWQRYRKDLSDGCRAVVISNCILLTFIPLGVNNHLMSLKKDLAKGTLYLAIAKYSGIIVSLGVTAVLSRILTPEDYGVVAIAFVFITFFNILSDIGIGPAIIQNKELTKEDINNIFSYTVYSGIILGIIFYFCSGLIAKFYAENQLIDICKLLCISIIFYCINIVPTNLLYKEKRFKYASYSSLIVQIILGGISILAAYGNFGLYSLLISPILSPLFLFLIYNHHTRLSFRSNCKFSSLKKILSFSVYQFLFNLVNYFSRNADKLLLGKYVGLAPLGQYEKSYRLMMLPLQNITFVITPVMHPIFSEFQNNLYILGSKYCKVINTLAYLAFPLSALLYYIAEPLIILFFGNQWHEAVLPFQILSFSVGIQIITSTTGSIFQASNSTKQLFYTGLIVALIMIISFIIAACIYKSIIAMAYAFLIAKCLDMVISFYSLMRTINYPIKQVAYSMLIPIIIGCLTYLALGIFNRYIKGENIYISLIINIIFWLIITITLCETIGEIKPIKIFRQLIHNRFG